MLTIRATSNLMYSLFYTLKFSLSIHLPAFVRTHLRYLYFRKLEWWYWSSTVAPLLKHWLCSRWLIYQVGLLTLSYRGISCDVIRLGLSGSAWQSTRAVRVFTACALGMIIDHVCPHFGVLTNRQNPVVTNLCSFQFHIMTNVLSVRGCLLNNSF